MFARALKIPVANHRYEDGFYSRYAAAGIPHYCVC